jgi:Ca-activated chloride channel family protein
MKDERKARMDAEARRTAFALGELEALEATEREALEEMLASDPALAAELEETRALGEALAEGLGTSDSGEGIGAERRSAIEARLATRGPRRSTLRVLALAASVVLLVGLGGLLLLQTPLGDRLMPADHAAESFGYLGQYENWRAHAGPVPPLNRERYANQPESGFTPTESDAVSTFAVDVDTASYSNVRRMLRDGVLPPKGAVRIEELVNAIPYDYPPPHPKGGGPLAMDVEVASAPWNPTNRLVRVGLRARSIEQPHEPTSNVMNFRPPSNLVFLVDVSGSMRAPDKLPLLKRAFSLLVEQLDARDRVSVAVYAGASGLVLPPTEGANQAAILAALDGLEAGGSTNGGAGIELAYRLADENRVYGTNRVILATDGDFNVGVTDESSLMDLVRSGADQGTKLTILGFGTGNLADDVLEELTNRGDGNYAYIDSIGEARKVLVEELGSTLVTVAEDVKVQVEFNPYEVRAWRLVGYENRLLADHEFEDDDVDAGEVGAGHRVTALYEVVPWNGGGASAGGSRYRTEGAPTAAAAGGELLHLRLRWQPPGGGASRLAEVPVRDTGAAIEGAGEDTRFAAAVAGFGMLLSGSRHSGDLTFTDVHGLASGALGDDRGGHRLAFLALVQRAASLSGEETPEPTPQELEALIDLGYTGY